MDLARQSWNRAVEAGLDRPISWEGEWSSLDARRAIQYSKGALFMNALRRELGDDIFWRAFADYTRANMGRTLISEDFQAAFEASSGRDLDALFQEWVF